MIASLRRHLPWLVAVLVAVASLHLVWPDLLHETLQAHRQARSLEAALPDSASLRKRVETLAHDSSRLPALREALSRRTVQAADPAARAVEASLATLTPAGLRIESVQPDLEGSRIRIRLAGSASLGQLRQGLVLLEQGALHVQVRNLSLRKSAQSLRFDLELLYAGEVSP